uniref:acid phosphatase n=1 Tax=Dendroctonus ponderosae TaxID=77166 RepID=A0AAR5Q8L7_DENPD
MMWLRLLTAFALAALCGAAAPYKEEDDLKAVIVLYRHGDRSPLSSWPNDVYFTNTSLWPDGYGQLNNMGKQRHYQLGKWFRERYDGFLPRKYNYHDIYVRSTDVDRTLMSAASNLAGLYPPEGDQIWNENLLWQPIPIHTTPEDLDPVLTTKVECASYDELFEEFKNSSAYTSLSSGLSDLFQNISALTGYDVNELEVSSFSGLFSTITIYRHYNLTLPAWTEEYWPVIKYWAAKKGQWHTNTTELSRLRVGPFFDYILGHLDSIERNSSTATEHLKGPRQQLLQLTDKVTQKFLMLSAHDTTVADVTNAMRVYVDAVPEFCSTVIWELKTGRTGSYVNMYFKNSTHFTELILPDCKFNCPYDDYVRLLEPITLSAEEWAEKCNS